jgi:hypothetical protein
MERTIEHPTILAIRKDETLAISSGKYEFMEGLYEKAMGELHDFFGLNWARNRPRLFLVSDRETIDNLKGYKTEDWVVGWASNNNDRDVYVLDKDNYTKESRHKYSDEEYFRLIKHELAHLFFRRVSGFKSEPHWLNDGVCTYLSGQIPDKEIRLHSFLEHYSKSGPSVYTEGGLAVKYLVEKYGKTKLLELIKSLKNVNSEDEFKKAFEKIYGFELDYSNFQD